MADYSCYTERHDEWQTELPLNLGKSVYEYLEDLRKNLEMAQQYATTHVEKAQQMYVPRYNLRALEKSFEVGQKVSILMPDSTSSNFFLVGLVQELLGTKSHGILIR